MKETPTTEQVREGYAVAFIPSAKERGRRRFNSWLTKHDAEVKAEAWDEAVDTLSRHWEDFAPKAVADLERRNPYRADRIERADS